MDKSLWIKHPAEIEGVSDLIDDSIESKVMVTDLLQEISDKLSILIKHAELITDEEIENGD